MKVLFFCYSHQRDYFLTSHAECIKNRGGEANFLILDEGEEGSSRSRQSLITIPSDWCASMCIIRFVTEQVLPETKKSNELIMSMLLFKIVTLTRFEPVTF